MTNNTQTKALRDYLQTLVDVYGTKDCPRSWPDCAQNALYHAGELTQTAYADCIPLDLDIDGGHFPELPVELEAAIQDLDELLK